MTSEHPGYPITSSPDAGMVLRTGTQRVVFDVVRASGGTTTQQAIPGISAITRTVPGQWADGILAARKVADAASNLMRDYARRARGAGMSWAQLADPLGIARDQDTDRAEAAFELIAGQPTYAFDRVSTAWRCITCDQDVTDMGPYDRHPTDCEQGHAPSCARHQREIRAYDTAGAGE